MTDETESRRLYAVEARAEAVTRLLVRSHQVLAYTFVVASFAVPLATFVPRESDDQAPTSYRLWGLFSVSRRFPELYGHQALGSALVRAGAALLALALVLTVVSLVLLLTSESPRAPFSVVASLGVLLGTLVVTAGLALLPKPDQDRGFGGIEPTWLLLVPVLTAAWTLVHAASVRELRD